MAAMRLTPLIAPVIVALAGCASGSSHELHAFGSSRVDLEEVSPSSAPAAKRKERRPIPLSKIAAGYRTAQLCERAARSMQSFEPNKAWALLMACADRDDFTLIDTVLAHPWITEIKRRQQAGAELISRIVSNRGGNLKLDLTLANDRGVQLFRLETVMKNARVFRGRYVLMRGKIGKVKPHGAGISVELQETSLQAQNIERRFSRWRAYKMSRKGGSSRAMINSGAKTGRIVVDSHNISRPTNRSLVAFTERAIVGLKQGEERLFLVRFADARRVENDDFAPDAMTGTAALIAAYAPIEDVLK